MSDESTDANNETEEDDCQCPACQMRRLLQDEDGESGKVLSIGLVNLKDQESSIDLKQVLGEIVAETPHPMRILVVADLIGCMCMAATIDDLPEHERADVDNWEGRSPRDFFEQLAAAMPEALPDAEEMVNRWNNFELQQIENAAASDVEVTIPADWTS